MSTDEIFSSQVRSIGDLAGVFEFDGDTGYFYFYRTTEPQGQKVIGSIRVFSGMPDFEEEDVAVCWDETESKVGLRIRGKLWAAFDATTGAAFGGNYHADSRAEIPTRIVACFESTGKAN